MRDLDFIDEDQTDTVFRDLIMLTLAGFVVMVFLLLPHINPKAQASGEIKSPGNLIVEARWGDDLDSDIDLWVRAPSDIPVGYSNQSATLFNLLRDDLGRVNDLSNLNYEVAYSRGIPAGDYAVNLHLYSNRERKYPVDVKVTVSVKATPHDSAKPILTRDISMLTRGEERTVLRFKIDDQQKLIKESVHDTPTALRAMKKTNG